jgi:hypothetical protein
MGQYGPIWVNMEDGCKNRFFFHSFHGNIRSSTASMSSVFGKNIFFDEMFGTY